MQFFARCIVPFPVFSILNGSVFGGKKRPIYDHLFNKVFTFKYPFYPKIGGIHGILVRASYVCMYVSMIQNRIRLM